MFQSSIWVCKEKRALVSFPKPGGSGEGLLCVWREHRHRGASWCCQRLAVGLEKPQSRLQAE